MEIKLNITRVFTESNRIIREKLIRLEGDISLSSLMNTVGWKLIILSIGTIKKATSRIRLYHKFSTYILVLTKRHGAEFTVKYLKACNLAISKFLAGEPFKSLRDIEPDLPLPRLTKSGLPVIIGTRDRRSLHANSHRVIRLWLTLFSLYRVIRIPAKAKLNTITDGFSGNPKFLEIVGNWMEFKGPAILQRFQPKGLKLQEKLPMDESASPTNSRSWMGMITDLSLLKYSPEFFSSFVRIAERTCSVQLLKVFNELSRLAPNKDSPEFNLLPMKDPFRTLLEKTKSPLVGLGQLQQKEEAAGKMRTFAMVDSWTQAILMPLHIYISDILRKIPNDGTASHDKAFDRVMARSKEFGCSYGYDLSAATDRLPIDLQIKLLSGLFDKQFAIDWAKILVGRPYFLLSKDKNKNFIFEEFWYKVGQPMGARSSFVMLGLTHHMLVQFCSNMLGNNGWETRYEIVGDDIVIFNKDLAAKYLEVMNLIGVPINVSKSVVSENRPVAEFVKRVCLNGKDVSPFSWKQFISQSNFIGRISTTIGLFKKEISLAQKAISVFHTVMKEKIYDTRPQRDPMALIFLYITYALKSNMNIQDLLRTLFLHKPVIENKFLVFKKFNFHEIGNKVKNMILTGKAPREADYHADYRAVNLIFVSDLAKKVIDLRRTWWIDRCQAHHELIILRILGDIWHCNNAEYYVEFRNILAYWMSVQQPVTTLLGYPWLGCSDSWSQDPGKFGFPDWQRLSFTDLLHMKFRNKDMLTTSNLLAVYELYQKCQEGLAFLAIHERVDKPKVEQVQDVVSHSLIKTLVETLEEIGKYKADLKK